MSHDYILDPSMIHLRVTKNVQCFQNLIFDKVYSDKYRGKIKNDELNIIIILSVNEFSEIIKKREIL